MILPRFFSFPDSHTGEGKAAGAENGGSIRCGLCPHSCLLVPGTRGLCRVRFNRDGNLELPFRGFVTALSVDPVEKKPLYHFRPGTDILSAGFAGCNLRCPFCQNWHISQSSGAGGRFLTAEELVKAALQTDGKAEAGENTETRKPSQIAYTYSEPLVHAEFLLDCMKEASKAKAANVLVSNGCVNAEAAGEILDLTDAANIDLKCFSEDTYKKILSGDLKTVTAFIRAAVEKGVHLEITTLVVPGLNDSRAELDKCRDFVAELQTEKNAVPWHLSAYHPDWKWRAPATENNFLLSAVKRAREKLPFVYAGNTVPPGEDFNDTRCARCGNVLIRRRGFRVNVSGLSPGTENGSPAYFCSRCGKAAPVRR